MHHERGFKHNMLQLRHVRSNSALVSDVYAAALRAFYGAPQRGR
jgi:hypothetical protein